MTVIEVPDDLAQLDAAIEAVPNRPAVFALFGQRKASRIFPKPACCAAACYGCCREREKPSRLLNLRHTVGRIEYRLTGSALESSIVLYEQARRLFPETYAGSGAAAHAAVRENRARQRISAQPHHHRT